MGPAAKTWCFLSRETQIGLVHERRRLQRVLRRLSLHVLPSQTPQLVIDERSQFLERAGITTAPLLQELCHFLRAGRSNLTGVRSPDTAVKPFRFAIHPSRSSKKLCWSLINFSSVSCLSEWEADRKSAKGMTHMNKSVLYRKIPLKRTSPQ